jgi:hypothetical protein
MPLAVKEMQKRDRAVRFITCKSIPGRKRKRVSPESRNKYCAPHLNFGFAAFGRTPE